MDDKLLKSSVNEITMSYKMRNRIILNVSSQTQSAVNREINWGIGINMRRAVTVVLVAVLVFVTAGLAYAVYNSEWLAQFFTTQSDGQLTPNQYEYIEVTSVGIGQSVAVDGYTVTVDSAICDKNNLFVVINIQGPQGVNIEDESKELTFDNVKIANMGTDVETGYFISMQRSWLRMDDGDGQQNTATILMQQTRIMSADSNFSYADGELRSVQFSNLRVTENGSNEEILAQGDWNFEFYLSEAGDEIEFISSPVICEATAGGEGSLNGELATKEYIDIMVTSFKLSPLGAVCTHTYGINERVESVDILEIKIVMKDGTTVIAVPKSGGGAGGIGSVTGTMVYTFDVPIILDEVEYLILPTNVQVPISGDNSHLALEQEPTEDEIMEDYHKAQQAISWFKSSTAPLNYEIFEEYNGTYYYKVADFQYDTDFVLYLYSLFSPELITPYFSNEETRIYKTIDGELYCLDVEGRGTDPSKGDENYDIHYEDDDTVILTVTVEILDTENDFEIIGTEDYVFIYECVDGEWVFTEFPIIR